MPKCSLREYTYNYECVIYLKTKHGIRFNWRPNTPYVENGRRSRTSLLNYCTQDDGKTFERLIFRLEILRIKTNNGKRNRSCRKKKVIIVHSVRTGSFDRSASYRRVRARCIIYYIACATRTTISTTGAGTRAYTTHRYARITPSLFTCLFPMISKFPVQCDDAQERRNQDNNRTPFYAAGHVGQPGSGFLTWTCARLSFSPRHFRFCCVRVECPTGRAIAEHLAEFFKRWPNPGWPVWKGVYAYV